ncbi:hypothetical protein L6164_001239 [Bauhinia variegata]|uniref:Uncharacterized protein n=1 Tax=Bauhinia variegata TaxID=167791 RepID=A0ACB9QAB1_BAUVA|nr:hypothetical protein L6164_001239 [Bauhinia variegata]
MLEEEEAEEIAKNPKVVSVFLNKKRKLHTTRSWQFLGLEENGILPKDSIWEKARYGEDTIIGKLDTGFEARHDVKPQFTNARDVDGHGSHTLSTAGGSFVPGVSIFGNGFGTAKGGSPKARVAAYKVCWPDISETMRGGCFDADVLAGFEAAISDNVDLPRGIVVVNSAGNEGPRPETVASVVPWMITVAASTIDRSFASYVALGDKSHLKGSSLSPKGLPSQKFYPLINAEDAELAKANASDA